VKPFPTVYKLALDSQGGFICNHLYIFRYLGCHFWHLVPSQFHEERRNAGYEACGRLRLWREVALSRRNHIRIINYQCSLGIWYCRVTCFTCVLACWSVFMLKCEWRSSSPLLLSVSCAHTIFMLLRWQSDLKLHSTQTSGVILRITKKGAEPALQLALKLYIM